jgi:basic membrane lipoprotein Med (substrate-binding protein (PBP1-ABC) superfamily)
MNGSDGMHRIRPIARRALLRLAMMGSLALALQPTLASAQDKFRVAAIFSTPIEEPWVNQIHVALQRAEKELGVEYKWAEHVASADYQRVLREFARDGYPLIVGDAFAAEDIARRVAREFPETAFVFGSGQARPSRTFPSSTTGSMSRPTCPGSSPAS